MMRESFNRMLAEDGGATYLRLSTRQLDQPIREMTKDLEHDLLAGAYWLMPPGPNCDVVIAAMGALMPEAISAHQVLLEDCPDAGLLAVTSPDQLHKNWLSAEQGAEEFHLARLFAEVPQNAGIVTICDAHPATLSWLGASLVREQVPLGVEGFGQSADLPDLYRSLKIDSDAIVDAAARLIWRLMNE